MSAFVTFHPYKCSPSPLRDLRACPWQGERCFRAHTSLFLGTRLTRRCNHANFDTSLRIRQVPSAMFSGGGILGVGPSEIIVIVAVGWLLLGPQKLYALAKDTGRLFGELSRTAAEARDSFTEAIETDMMASEAKGKISSEEDPNKELDGKEEKGENESKHALKDADKRNNDVAEHSGRTVASDSEAISGTSVNPGVSQEFLDQLKRVSDPNQAASPDVSDLSAGEDEQKEFERLEREYFAAKRRMQGRKSQAQATNSQDGTAAKEER